MRKLVACWTLCLASLYTANAMGQTKTFPGYDESPKSSAAKRPVRDPSAARLIQQRALKQAAERRARIQARKWQGISLMRPTVLTADYGHYGWQQMSDPYWWMPRHLGWPFGWYHAAWLTQAAK